MIPYDTIDPGIVGLVRLLNESGFSTIGSCEGGEGHTFSLPTIQIANRGTIAATRQELCTFLLSRGAHGFTISEVYMHQSSHDPEPYSYVEVELWSQDILRYLTF